MVTPLPLPAQDVVPSRASRPKIQYTLAVEGDTFLIGNGTKKEALTRVARDPKRRDEASFRRDKRWAVWDERGLTTRDGDWTATDRLEGIAVSPKVQAKEGIAATFKTKRARAASGLSGARRVGSLVYLLPRWDDADGKPWLEALLVVDLGKPHPKPRLLGPFGGLSLGRGRMDDRLGLEGGTLTAAVNDADAWGVATYDPKRERFGFRPRGVHLFALEGDRIIEATAYGTTLAGRQAGGRTIPWMETRGPAEFVPGAGSVLVRTGDRLRNAVTGAELRLAPDAEVRRSSAGLLVFWPAAAPRSARLIDPMRFEERARWERGTRP